MPPSWYLPLPGQKWEVLLHACPIGLFPTFLTRDANCPLNCFPELSSPSCAQQHTAGSLAQGAHWSVSVKDLHGSRDSSPKASGFIVYTSCQLGRCIRYLLTPPHMLWATSSLQLGLGQPAVHSRCDQSHMLTPVISCGLS